MPFGESDPALAYVRGTTGGGPAARCAAWGPGDFRMVTHRALDLTGPGVPCLALGSMRLGLMAFTMCIELLGSWIGGVYPTVSWPCAAQS